MLYLLICVGFVKFLFLPYGFVVVRFWHSSRSWHVSRRQEAPLTCQGAKLTYKPHMSSRRKPLGHVGPRKSLGPHPPSPH